VSSCGGARGESRLAAFSHASCWRNHCLEGKEDSVEIPRPGRSPLPAESCGEARGLELEPVPGFTSTAKRPRVPLDLLLLRPTVLETPATWKCLE